VGLDTTPPSVSVLESINVTTPGTQVSFQLVASDDVGVTSQSLTVNGVTQTVGPSGLVNFTPMAPGLYTIVGPARDAAGNVGTATTTLRVIDPNDHTYPTVIIISPTSDSTVTFLTPIVGTVTDADLDFYAVEYSRAGTDDWHLIRQQTTTGIVNGTLATFDPTLLANDAYIIRVTAEDVSGNIYSVQTTVNVTQNAKLGNFHLEYTDLSIPLAGIPITIYRVYDTLQADQSGAFGYG
jgi:hypothetical protein